MSHGWSQQRRRAHSSGNPRRSSQPQRYLTEAHRASLQSCISTVCAIGWLWPVGLTGVRDALHSAQKLLTRMANLTTQMFTTSSQDRAILLVERRGSAQRQVRCQFLQPEHMPARQCYIVLMETMCPVNDTNAPSAFLGTHAISARRYVVERRNMTLCIV